MKLTFLLLSFFSLSWAFANGDIIVSELQGDGRIEQGGLCYEECKPRRSILGIVGKMEEGFERLACIECFKSHPGVFKLKTKAGDMFGPPRAGEDEECRIEHSQNFNDYMKVVETLNQGNCEANVKDKKFKGSSVEAAVEKCADHGLSEKECASSVRCPGVEKLCHTSFAPYSYPGINGDKAVQLCVLAGRKEQECASATVCPKLPGIGHCQAKMGSINYPGYSVKETIELCVRSGRKASACADNINCTGFKKICHVRLDSGKYPGVTREEAIELCVLAGRSQDICSESVSCNEN